MHGNTCTSTVYIVHVHVCVHLYTRRMTVVAIVYSCKHFRDLANINSL